MTNLPRGFNDQVTFFDDLQTQLNTLSSLAEPIFLSQSSEPTQKQWEDAWIAAGKSVPIDTRSELYWYDGTNLRGMFGTVDDWIRRELLNYAHYVKLSTLTGAMVYGASQFLDDYSYVFLNTDQLSGSAAVRLSKVVQGIYSNINTGAATPVVTSPIRVNPAGTAIAFKDSAGNLRTINSDGTSLTTVIATVCGQICDWRTTKILYVDSSNVLKYVDENGTGDTTVLNLYGATCRGARFDQAMTRIYYSIDTEIRSVLLNGTGDQLESYSGSYVIIDTYGTDEIVFREQLPVVLSGSTTFSTPTYKKATITDIKNTAVEFNKPLDFRDLLNTTQATNPVRDGAAFVPVNFPAYSPMRNFFRPTSSHNGYFSGALIDDISPNGNNILLTTQNGDIYLGANRNEGYDSTGRVSLLNYWENQTPDFEKLGSFDINTAAALHHFTVPQTHTHLMVEGAIVVSAGAAEAFIRFNDDLTPANYMSFRIQNVAAQTKTENLALSGAMFSLYNTNPVPFRFYIINYRGAHIKSLIGRYGFSGASGSQRIVSAWNNTAAITKMSLSAGGVNVAAATTLNVYGFQGQGRYW